MEMELYVFEDEAGVLDTFTTTNADEARMYARENKRLWLCQVYEYADTEIVEDYREEGET